MIDYCDLYNMLIMNNKKMRDVGIYCKLNHEIERPYSLKSNVVLPSNSHFVSASIFAVDLSSYKSSVLMSGVLGETDNFLANGSFAVLVDNSVVLNDWYYMRGNLMLNKGYSNEPIGVLVRYTKVNSEFKFIPIPPQDFNVSKFENTRRQYKVLTQCVSENRIVMPSDVAYLTKIYAEPVLIPNAMPNTVSAPVITNPIVPSQVIQTPVNEPKIVESTPKNIGDSKTHVLMSDERNRDKIKGMPKEFEVLCDTLADANKRQDDYISKYKEELKISEKTDAIIETFFNKVRRNWKTKATNQTMTGQAMMKGYLNDSNEDLSEDYLGGTLFNYFLGIYDEIFDFSLKGEKIDVDGSALVTAKSLFSIPEILFAGLTSQFLPICSSKAMDIAETLNGMGMSYAYTLVTNPYLLTIFGFNVSYNDAEKIAYLLGIWNNKELEQSRNIAMLTSSVVESEGQDTCMSKSKMMTTPLGISVTYFEYKTKITSGEPMYGAKAIDNVRVYLNGSIVLYPKTGWVASAKGSTLEMSRNSKESALKDAINVGLLIEKDFKGKQWIFCKDYLLMETTIVKKAYELSKMPCKYTDISKMNKLIDIFEKKKGFKLEPEQRQGIITSVSNKISALSGPAGSGKTTASEGIIFTLENYDNGAMLDSGDPSDEVSLSNSDTKIEFATPTGKAAKRLQEVIGRKVSTMHSKFKVGIGKTTLLKKNSNGGGDVESNADFYIFDEVAMCNLNLLYTVFTRSGNSSIALLGDIAQLPPIGKGLPYRDLLMFIPCTFLRVSKRSLEGSGLTYNSDVINSHSNIDDFKPLESSDDCKVIVCPDDDIINKVYTICAYHLGKVNLSKAETILGTLPISDKILGNMTKDDIQVVVPVSKSNYTWGATSLNRRLQDLFNPLPDSQSEFGVTVFKDTKKFRIGDRIIHTDNMYAMQWYSRIDKGRTFYKDWGSGVMNGEVGKIVDIIQWNKKMRFHKQETPQPEDYEEPKYNLRNDKLWEGVDKYFVVVEFHDFSRNCEYYILYQAQVNEWGDRDEVDLSLMGEDLKSMDLAYALTTHKMQGSESKLVIFGLGEVRRDGFLTRNAVYTAETRARSGAYIVGNVSPNMNSMLNKARLIDAQQGASTSMSLVFE